jgi:hypothetical protein
MEPNEFIAEVYRRMGMRNDLKSKYDCEKEFVIDSSIVRQAIIQYKSILPIDKQSKILDIGFGNGWFIGAC